MQARLYPESSWDHAPSLQLELERQASELDQVTKSTANLTDEELLEMAKQADGEAEEAEKKVKEMRRLEWMRRRYRKKKPKTNDDEDDEDGPIGAPKKPKLGQIGKLARSVSAASMKVSVTRGLNQPACPSSPCIRLPVLSLVNANARR